MAYSFLYSKFKKERKIYMKKKGKIIFISAIILLIFIGIPSFYSFQLLEKVNIIKIPKLDDELGIKEEVVEKQNIEITNIALFGVDSRSSSYQGRSDSIIILSLDREHKKIKLSSIMRDSYVDIPGRGMDKINHAYAFGGPELSLKTINQNFNMNIREFVTVNFEGLEDIIDALGGVEINIKENEVKHVYGSFVGKQMLNGSQALTYSRIRSTGNGDFERTERQRVVLEKIINEGLNQGVAQYPKILNVLLPYVETSLSKNEILKLGTSIFTSNIKDVEKFRIPLDEYSKSEKINGVYYLVPDSLENNIESLHNFIYENKIFPPLSVK